LQRLAQSVHRAGSKRQSVAGLPLARLAELVAEEVEVVTQLAVLYFNQSLDRTRRRLALQRIVRVETRRGHNNRGQQK
jgi:hypothetical protein